jgi:DNA-directed RNA polymerase specialized sigma24 family protein
MTRMAVPEEATDEALASRAALGDNHAFDEITIRYQARVYRLACRLVGHDDAPDVVQEGFLSRAGYFARPHDFQSISACRSGRRIVVV